MPESPRWLCLRGRYKDALKVLKKFASWNKRTLPPDSKVIASLQEICPQVSLKRNIVSYSIVPGRMISFG